jgi:anti-sigma regulatory factor (Ser/Thr protein kinase)
LPVPDDGPNDTTQGGHAAISGSWTLTADTTAPWRARALAGALFADLDANRRDDVLLLVSELVTNAAEHGSGAGDAIGLSVCIEGHLLRVTVTDRSVAPPALRRVSRDCTHGRGLWIVDQLVDRWGVDVGESGKSVWVEAELGPTTGHDA